MGSAVHLEVALAEPSQVVLLGLVGGSRNPFLHKVAPSVKAGNMGI